MLLLRGFLPKMMSTSRQRPSLALAHLDSAIIRRMQYFVLRGEAGKGRMSIVRLRATTPFLLKQKLTIFSSCKRNSDTRYSFSCPSPDPLAQKTASRLGKRSSPRHGPGLVQKKRKSKSFLAIQASSTCHHPRMMHNATYRTRPAPPRFLCLGLLGLLEAPSSPPRLLVLLLHLLYRLEHRGVLENVGQYYELDVAAAKVHLLQLAHAPVSSRHRH